MGNVAYRVWDTEQAPVDRVQRAIKEMDKVSVINDRNFSSEFTFEFNVTKSGKLLTGAQADEVSEVASRLVASGTVRSDKAEEILAILRSERS